MSFEDKFNFKKWSFGGGLGLGVFGILSHNISKINDNKMRILYESNEFGVIYIYIIIIIVYFAVNQYLVPLRLKPTF